MQHLQTAVSIAILAVTAQNPPGYMNAAKPETYFGKRMVLIVGFFRFYQSSLKFFSRGFFRWVRKPPRPARQPTICIDWLELAAIRAIRS